MTARRRSRQSRANLVAVSTLSRPVLLAHREFRHAQDPTATPLKPGSRASVEVALAAIRDLMQVLEGYFRDTLVAYQYVDPAPGGAWDLLYHLELGLEARRVRDPLDGHWRPKYL